MCELLVDSGAEVTCLDNFSTGLKVNISHLERRKNFQLIESSIQDYHIENGFDHVIHFASRASPEEYQQNPIETLKVNSVDTIKLLEYASGHKSIFLFASSSEVYDNARIVHTPESYW